MASRSGLAVFIVVCPIGFGGNPAFAADTIPRWDINEVCATSALGAKCPRIESDNRRAVFNRWVAVPAADRTACERAIDVPGQRSYRALLTCLDDKAMKALEALPTSGGNS